MNLKEMEDKIIFELQANLDSFGQQCADWLKQLEKEPEDNAAATEIYTSVAEVKSELDTLLHTFNRHWEEKKRFLQKHGLVEQTIAEIRKVLR